MRIKDFSVMGGDYEKILALAKATYQARRAISAPYSSMPASNVHVRPLEIDLPVPFCLEEVAKSIRKDGEIPSLVQDWFKAIAYDTAPVLTGHTWVDDPADVRAYPKSDRIVTARYTIDTAELDGRRLAVFLGLSLGIYDKMKARIETASKSFAEKYPDKSPRLRMASTRPTLHLKLDAYMLESFAWVVSGGGIEPAE